MVTDELYIVLSDDNLTNRAEYDDVELDKRYVLVDYPDHYFIVRKDLYSECRKDDRMCLYRTGVVNPYLTGNEGLFDLFISNEVRGRLTMEAIVWHMEDKIRERCKKQKKR